jgi:hypothetical protein
VHQVGDQPRSYYDARSTNHQDPIHAFCENMLKCVLCHYCSKNLIRLGPCGLAWELGPLCSVIFSARGATFPQHVWVFFYHGIWNSPYFVRRTTYNCWKQMSCGEMCFWDCCGGHVFERVKFIHLEYVSYGIHICAIIFKIQENKNELHYVIVWRFYS